MEAIAIRLEAITTSNKKLALETFQGAPSQSSECSAKAQREQVRHSLFQKKKTARQRIASLHTEL